MRAERNKKLDKWISAAAVALALVIWQAAAMGLDSELLLASPVTVAVRLATLWREPGFFGSLAFTAGRIVGGFLLALAVGAFLGVLAGRFPVAELLLRPFMVTVRTVPVASFIIIALVWLSAAQLSGFISFLMALPIIYAGVLSGIRSVDEKMAEAAEVFRVPWQRRLIYIWLPQLRPFLVSSAGVAVGLAWKAGVAAEVIGIPNGSVGEALYEAKLYLSTPDLLAWTVVIVLASVIFEKAFLALLRLAFRGLERL